MLGKDGNWLIAGVAAALAIPVLVFGLALPLALALGLGALGFVGLVFVLAPRRVFEGIDVSRVARGRLDLARQVLTDAEPRISRLDEAAGTIRSAVVKAQVGRLAKIARAIIAGVEQDANRLGSVQRFLTYYLPAASDVAQGYGVLERRRQPAPARLAQAEAVIAKLEDAFSHYADSLLDADLEGLDVELRLVESALKDDLGTGR